MRPQCGLRAELTEAAVEAARKSPVSRTRKPVPSGAGFFFVKVAVNLSERIDGCI